MKTRKIPKLTDSDVARFKAKIFKTKRCWSWMARLLPNGYGQFVICRERKEHFLAHRVAFEIFKGPIPKGKVIRHKCDNPHCVNPKHLFVGDQVKNYQDSLSRGRTAGQVCPERLRTRQKLTEEQARAILASPLSQRACAKLYGVSPAAIMCIRTGRTWKYLCCAL